MSLNLDMNEAAKADRKSDAIRIAGKYVGVITRAEKLLSKEGTEGFGLSFKSDDGQTANYLDLYTKNSKGETLPSNSTVNAILACTRSTSVDEGKISIEKYDKEAKTNYATTVEGYPSLMGKRIGLLLQQELSTYNGKDNDRVVIYGVFEANTELVSSEIAAKKTEPEKLEKMMIALMARPVNDRRVKSNAPQKSGDDFYGQDAPHNSNNFDPDINF